MDCMICLSHFCEIHGPTSILCTQALRPREVQSEIEASGNVVNTCDSCRLILPDKYIRDGEPLTCMETRVNTDSSDDEENELCYFSSQYPASQERFKAIRLACLRTLSSEHVFNDNAPMMFTDPAIGTAIMYGFKAEDESSRGQIRRYGITCICENETKLAHAWNIITPHIDQIGRLVQQRSSLEAKRVAMKKSPNERYLRPRDIKKVPKSLVTILNDDVSSCYATIVSNIRKSLWKSTQDSQ